MRSIKKHHPPPSPPPHNSEIIGHRIISYYGERGYQGEAIMRDKCAAMRSLQERIEHSNFGGKPLGGLHFRIRTRRNTGSLDLKAAWQDT